MPHLRKTPSVNRRDFRYLLYEERLTVLSTPLGRRQLVADPSPYWIKVFKCCNLGYTNDRHGGVWSVRIRRNDRNRVLKLGYTDDLGERNDTHFDFDEACQRARMVYADPNQYIYPLSSQRHSSKQLEFAPSTDQYTVTNAMHDFIDANRGAMADATLSAHIQVANKNILPVLGAVSCNELTVASLRKWFSEIDVTRRSERNIAQLAGIGPRAGDSDALRRENLRANQVLRTLCAALNSALDDEKIERSPVWQRIKRRRIGHVPRRRTLTVEECQRLIAMSPKDLRELILGALYTGARLNELRNVRVSDFDYGRGQLFIYASKTRKARIVILSFEAMMFLERMCHTLGPTDRIFRRYGGREWTPSSHTVAFKKACHDAEIGMPFVFHDLRHTYASQLIMAGVSPFVISEQLGHCDIKELVRTYGHVTSDFVADQIRTLAPPIAVTRARLEKFATHHRSHFDDDGHTITHTKVAPD